MIQPKELRIGNLILKHNGEITKVSGQFIADFEKYGSEQLMTIPPRPFYTGIALTSEWLEKLGFVVNQYSGEWQLDPCHNCRICLNKLLQVSLWAGEYADGDDCHLEHIEYVHQLQNLYFALTGNELTIKDDGKEGK